MPVCDQTAFYRRVTCGQEKLAADFDPVRSAAGVLPSAAWSMMKGLGRATWGAGKLGLRGAEWLGDKIVKHPKTTLIAGVPMAMSVATAGSRFERNENNINPLNPYMY